MTDDSLDDDRTAFSPVLGRTAGVADCDPAPSGDSADPGGSALPIGTFLEEFELSAVVGEGGFGIVYLAWDHSLQRRVALKEYIPPSLAVRADGTQVHVRSERHRDTFLLGLHSFVNEARLLARFDHRSLVKVYRFWEANGTAYMVMPYYEGETMAARLAGLDRPPEEAWLMSVLETLSSALSTLHREQCYHRDVAPDNIILLAGSDLPVLLDFGAARQVIGDTTQALTVILKPGYAPVEQYAEVPGMKQGPWTDVYALGATIRFALTGRRPRAAVARLVHDDETSLAQSLSGRYSARFLAAIDDALRVRPEDRTQSIADLRRDLGLPAASDQTAPTPDAAGRGRALKTRTSAFVAGHRVRRAAALAAGTLAFAGCAAFWFAVPHRASVPAAVEAAPRITRQATERVPLTRVVPSALVPASVALPTLGVEPPPSAPSLATDVLSQFDVAMQHQTHGFDVDAQPERHLLKIDHDDLQFSVRSSHDGYLTLLVYGPDGSLTELLPNPMLGSPRLRAGQRVVLPSSMGARIPVGEPPGNQRFLVLVSERPRNFTALGATRTAGGYVAFPAASDFARRVAQWPKPTPALLGEVATCAAPSGCDDYGAARFEVQIVR